MFSNARQTNKCLQFMHFIAFDVSHIPVKSYVKFVRNK